MEYEGWAVLEVPQPQPTFFLLPSLSTISFSIYHYHSYQVVHPGEVTTNRRQGTCINFSRINILPSSHSPVSTSPVSTSPVSTSPVSTYPVSHYPVSTYPVSHSPAVPPSPVAVDGIPSTAPVQHQANDTTPAIQSGGGAARLAAAAAFAFYAQAG